MTRCPRCGFKFDTSYARITSCASCNYNISCDYVKCPKCGHEFSKYSK